MTKVKNTPLKSQGKAFIEAARALECDESEERFNEALAKIARHKPAEDKQPPGPSQTPIRKS